jgi:hypothetical protein
MSVDFQEETHETLEVNGEVSIFIAQVTDSCKVT